MEGKKSFTAYCDWIETFEELNDEEAGKLIKHLFRYVNDQHPEPPDRITKLMFAPIKSTLKRDLQKWLKRVEANKLNGKRGGRPKETEENPKNPLGYLETQTNPNKAKKPDSVSDRDSDRDKEVNIPTLDAFLDYAKSKEPLIVESDVRYKYEAWKENDWKDAKGKPIKNWKTKLMNSMKYFDKHKSIQDGYKQVEIINLDKQQTEDKIKDERENLQFRMAKAINNYSIDFHKANNIPIGDDVTDVKAGEEMEYIAKLLENYEEEFIGKVMTWLWINKENGETFWRKYVINAKKFYEKFEKMKLAMINNKQKEKRL
jgi:hypothetical protein